MNRVTALILMALASIGMTQFTYGQVVDGPSARMRPLGSPSAVDQYLPNRSPDYRETVFQNQGIPSSTVALTQFEPPQLPPDGTAPPVVVTPGAGGFQSPPVTSTPPPPVPTAPIPTAPTTIPTAPPAQVPMAPTRTLPSGQGNLQPVPMQSNPVPSSSDLSPIVRPQLGNEFATIDNCSNISPPSGYSAAIANGCATPVSYEYDPTYATPTAAVAAPVVVPAAYRPPKPLFSFGQDRNPVVVGQGLVGQPVAYVPGQKFRNFFRYLFP